MSRATPSKQAATSVVSSPVGTGSPVGCSGCGETFREFDADTETAIHRGDNYPPRRTRSRYNPAVPINKCGYTFKQVVTERLPLHMTAMKKHMGAPIPMEVFATSGVAECRKQLGQDRDFSGCYVLIEGSEPIYTGISRKVMSRLRQHVKGKTHFDASLAYRMAKHGLTERRHRAKWMEDDKFLKRFATQQKRIRKMSVAVVRIDCPVELYAFELFCAMELDTGKWNTFATH